MRLCRSFLKYWREQGKGEEYEARIVAYADDFVILTKPSPHGRLAVQARDWTQRVMERIGLTLNERKTSIRDAQREDFDFLGYTFGPRYWWKTGGTHLAAFSCPSIEEEHPPPGDRSSGSVTSVGSWSMGGSSRPSQRQAARLAELLPIWIGRQSVSETELLRQRRSAAFSASSPYPHALARDAPLFRRDYLRKARRG